MKQPRLLNEGLASALYALLLLVFPAMAGAEGWSTIVFDMPQVPPRVIAVDKESQRLTLLGKQSPLAIQDAFDCTTGQIPGPKNIQDDLRTPEGIYFITGKIDRGLDFGEYGGIAYPLNYPNPIDRLKGKTGYGIWIHSRGYPITPLSTRGCVAVNLDAIEKLGPKLVPGTAVVLAENVATDAAGSPAPAGSIARQLEEKTREWNSAWAGRSPEMFALYDAASYSKAQRESFEAFRAQKERLFRTLPWIHIIYRDIHVLQGPDYWVTWFDQYYRAPNLTTEGVRRLYWQAGEDGELRIVGMEWLPQNLGLETAYLDAITPSVSAFVEAWRTAWEKADLEAYAEFYANNAQQGNLTGRAAIRQSKEQLWARSKPTSVGLTSLRVTLDRAGARVDMTQTYRSTSGGDKGVKVLLLEPEGEGWKIVSETWRAQ